MAEDRRIERIVILLTPAEKDRIGQDFLTSNAPSLSAYVRDRLLPFDPEALTEDEGVAMVVSRPIPDAATTVPPKDPLPARTQDQRDEEAPVQAEEYQAAVAKHRQKTSLPNAERLARKELGYEKD